MQVIYIDTLVCVNLFIDFFILCTTKKVLHINASNLRIIIAAAIGAASSLIILMPIYSAVISAIYKVIISFVITITAFSFADIRRMILRSAVFFSISIALCGVVVLLNRFTSTGRIIIYNDTLYFDISPTVLICATLVCHLTFTIYEKLFTRNNLNCQINTITIHTSDNNIYSFESAIDTGCHLTEHFSGSPVILAEKELMSDIKLPIEKIRYIFFETAAGSTTVKGFRPESIYINNKKLKSECYIGICENKLKGEVKSIMGTELMEAL